MNLSEVYGPAPAPAGYCWTCEHLCTSLLHEGPSRQDPKGRRWDAMKLSPAQVTYHREHGHEVAS